MRSEDDEAANNPAAEIWTKSSFETRFGKKFFRVIFNKLFTILFNAALNYNPLCEAEVGSRESVDQRRQHPGHQLSGRQLSGTIFVWHYLESSLEKSPN